MGQKLLGKDFVMMMERDGEMVPVCCSRDLSIEISGEVKEATKPPYSAWRSFYAGMLSYSVSCSGLVIIGDSFTLNDFYTMITSRQSLAFIAINNASKDLFFAGKVILNSISINAPNKDLITYSISATGDGPLLDNNPYEINITTDELGQPLEDGDGNMIYEQESGSLLPINLNIDC